MDGHKDLLGRAPENQCRRKRRGLIPGAEGEASAQQEHVGFPRNVLVPPARISARRKERHDCVGSLLAHLAVCLRYPAAQGAAVGRVDKDRAEPRQGQAIVAEREVHACANWCAAAICGG